MVEEETENKKMESVTSDIPPKVGTLVPSSSGTNKVEQATDKPKADDLNNKESDKDKRAEGESKSPKEQDKKESKKPAKKVKVEAKEFAVARGRGMRLSEKHCFAICKMLKGKTPERAVEILEAVVKLKKPVPMAGREVPHQKGRGIAGARFPQKAASEIIGVVKQLDANAIVNGVENPIIVIAKADKASGPFKRDGRRGKRTHVYFEARDRTKLVKKKDNKTRKRQGKKSTKKMRGGR